MVPLALALPRRRASILCLGAHPDDIEIGCGGTLLTLVRARSDLAVTWVVLSGSPRRAAEARASARRLLRAARSVDVRVLPFRDAYFPDAWGAIKASFDGLGRAVAPDLVFTHYGADRHQDHRVVSELTWNTFRDHLILEYEVPKYDGDLGQPNVFVPLDARTRQRKLRHLRAAFPSQRGKRWYDTRTFLGLLRLRGVECGAPQGYAEAFYARKLTLGA